MPCGHEETSGSSWSGRSLPRHWTGFSTPAVVHRRPATGSRGTSWSSRSGSSWPSWRRCGRAPGAAAAIAIVAPEPQDDRQSALLQYDLGQATFAMTVAAADLEVGTGHAAATDQDQARAVLGFPETHFLAYVLSAGYPSDRPLTVIERLDRRPFDEVVHRGRW